LDVQHRQVGGAALSQRQFEHESQLKALWRLCSESALIDDEQYSMRAITKQRAFVLAAILNRTSLFESGHAFFGRYAIVATTK
jgi:hypothetical protein